MSATDKAVKPPMFATIERLAYQKAELLAALEQIERICSVSCESRGMAWMEVNRIVDGAIAKAKEKGN